MGLFGFFATMVGLGAMTKDVISDGIDDIKSHKMAMEKGNDFYLVNGYKMRSTKTGRDCIERADYNTGHIFLCDFKTGEKIVDRTENINREKTEKNRRESKEKGWAFYRTCEFDLPGGKWSNVWISDSMPGKYFSYRRFTERERIGNVYFQEGELIDNIIGNTHKKSVKINYNTPCYNRDGTIMSK